MAALLSLLLFLSPATVRTGEILVPPCVQLGDRSENGNDTVAIVWQSPDFDGEYSVRYTQAGHTKSAFVSFKEIKVEGVEPHRVYSAELAGLTPGVKVNYKVMSADTSLFSSEFAAPKSDSQPYTFSVFGDCGVATTDQANVAYQVFKQRPDLLVMTGDLVYGRGLLGEYHKNFFPYYTAELATPKNGGPVFCTTLTAAAPGNHDILYREMEETPQTLAYYYYWNQPLNGPNRKNGDPNTPTLTGPEGQQQAFLANAGPAYPCMSNYSFDYGNAHWTVLDANPYVNWNDPKMRTWLIDDLKYSADKTWHFVAFHQPGFQSSEAHQSEKQMRAVADIFEDGKVDVVFAGHVHNYQRSKPIQVGPKRGASKEEQEKDDWPVDNDFDGITKTSPKGVVYIVSGGGGAGLYNPELNGHPELWKPFQATYQAKYSFSLAKVNGKKFSFEQIDKDGNVIDKFTIQK